MGDRRQHLSESEIVRVMRFIADVAARRADPLDQRQFIIESLQSMVGAQASFVYACKGWRPEMEARFVSQVISRGSTDIFKRYADEVLTNGSLYADPFCKNTLARPEGLVSVSAREVLPDLPAMHEYQLFIDCLRSCRWRDGQVTFARLPGPSSAIFGVGIHRFDSDQDFTDRDRAMIDFAIAELSGLIARGHLQLPELGGGSLDPSAGLPSRLGEVLSDMLAGRAPKQIAKARNLSVHTVREHIKRLYKRFDVNSREELMARFIKPPNDGNGA